MDDYERVLLVKPDIHVYKIPPRVSNRAYRASDWNLETPDWNCRLRLISKGDELYIKLDEKATGQFFGKCPIEKYPSQAIEPVSDSSRYFVLRLVNEQTGRHAFLGIGFVDRSDSFDLNVALQDHFKIMQMQNESETATNTPKLDLKFKEGETIKVNLNIGNKPLSSKPRPKPSSTSGFGILLPPPPSSKSSIKSSEHSESDTVKTTISQDKLCSDDFLSSPSSNSMVPPNKNLDSNDGWEDFVDDDSTDKLKSKTDINPANSNDLWSDFTSCNSNDNSDSNTKQNANQFDDWAKF